MKIELIIFLLIINYYYLINITLNSVIHFFFFKD